MTTTVEILCSDPCLFCHGTGPSPANNASTKYEHGRTNARRRIAGLAEITGPRKEPKRTACSLCGCPLDERTPDCPTCHARHRQRVWTARRMEAVRRRIEQEATT